MADRRDEREGRESEDLFDDLDKFFAPIEETDWPEPAPAGEPEPAPFEAVAEPTAETEAGAPEPGGLEEPEPTGPVEPPEPMEPPEQIDEAAWADIGATFGGQAFGGEGEEEESFLFGPPAGEPGEQERAAPPPAGDEGPAYTEPGFGLPGEDELTLEDLKVAPPEYADLPGPGEVERIEAERAAPRREPPPPPEPEPAAPTRAEEPVEEPFVAGEPVEEPSFAATFGEAAREEPRPDSRSAAERAADHFAEGLRERPSAEEDALGGRTAAEGPAPRTLRVEEEPVTGVGPVWEEPTARTVAAEPAAAEHPAARNLPAAVISGAALGVLALILLMIGTGPFAILAAAVVLLAQGEIYAVARGRGYQPATALGLVAGAMMLWAAYNRTEAAMAFVLALGTALSFLWYMAAPAKARKGLLANAAVTLLGVAYVPFFAGFLFRLMPIPGGRAIVITIIGLTVLYDVAAFGVGWFWGHRPLAPTISPNKSWEGAIAATLVTGIVALAAVPSIRPFDFLSAAGLALVVVVAAPLGDLAESVVKRDLGVKDMSTILPGHGGLMDRIDSLLFVAPAAFYFLRLVF